jgi:hypothetical protein
MALGKSGDKIVQLVAAIVAIYVMYIAYKIKDPLLFAIGLFTFLYDGYLVLFEKRTSCS